MNNWKKWNKGSWVSNYGLILWITQYDRRSKFEVRLQILGQTEDGTYLSKYFDTEAEALAFVEDFIRSGDE